ASADSRSHRTAARRTASDAGAARSRSAMASARTAAAAAIDAASAHAGQLPRSTSRPCAKAAGGYLNRSSNTEGDHAVSVGHAVDDVVHPHSECQRRERLGVLGRVGPLPGIPEMHVVADRDDDPSLVVADRAPLGDIAVLLVRSPRPDILLARHLEAHAEIEQNVEDLVVVA